MLYASHYPLSLFVECCLHQGDPFIQGGWNALRSFHYFFVTIICLAQAWALTSLPSPPSQVVSEGYDPKVRSYIDDETLGNV